MSQAATTTQPKQADPPADARPLVRVEHLKTFFPVRRGLMRKLVGHVRAVDDVSFDIQPGETLGLVGESGCGKSTVGRTMLRLIPPTEGSVCFDGEDVFAADRQRMHALRREMQIIFQDPVGSLNPRMTVGRIIAEPMQVHHMASGSELDDRVSDLLKRVGLESDHRYRYPHEFSGGQRQRIGIARALSLKPRFIVCDEPVSALDVSIQSQILNLLSDLQQEFGLAYLFIAHNLAVVEHFCDRVAVMYLGRIVEVGTRDQLYDQPLHPYTRALLSAAPRTDPSHAKKRIMLTGDVPSPIRMLGAPADGSDVPSGDEAADMRIAELAEGAGNVEFVTRASLLHRPDLKPVPDDPGHLVSADDVQVLIDRYR